MRWPIMALHNFKLFVALIISVEFYVVFGFFLFIPALQCEWTANNFSLNFFLFNLFHGPLVVPSFLSSLHTFFVDDSSFSTLQSLSHRRIVAILSPLCCYSHENCSDELRFIFPPILTFTVNFFSPLMRFNFHSISFFSTELLLWRTHSKDNAPRPEDS